MVVGYKERQYSPQITCEVYRNLRTGSLSVRAKEGEHKGLVIDHLSEVHLKDCSFKVNENGRQKVIENNRKNVHATVTGILCSQAQNMANSVPITYNPYKFESFVTKDDHTPVEEAEAVSIVVEEETVDFLGENVVEEV